MRFAQADLAYAVDAALAAGDEILSAYEGHNEPRFKDGGSPVTEADTRAHHVITTRLSDRYPDIPVVSEEAGDLASFEIRRTWDQLWLVDPLDGTKEFLKRNGQFTVNIAFVQGGRPLAGVVYAPALGLLYTGLVGSGASKRNERHVTVPMPIPAARSSLIIVGSQSHHSPEMDEFVARQRLEHRQVEFKTLGSSLKICLVAEGSADIYPRFGPTMEWDTAAAHAIAIAAGRRLISRRTQRELSYNKASLENDWFIAL